MGVIINDRLVWGNCRQTLVWDIPFPELENGWLRYEIKREGSCVRSPQSNKGLLPGRCVGNFNLLALVSKGDEGRNKTASAIYIWVSPCCLNLLGRCFSKYIFGTVCYALMNFELWSLGPWSSWEAIYISGLRITDTESVYNDVSNSTQCFRPLVNAAY